MINRWSESNIPNIENAKNIKNKTKQRNYFPTASRADHRRNWLVGSDLQKEARRTRTILCNLLIKGILLRMSPSASASARDRAAAAAAAFFHNCTYCLLWVSKLVRFAFSIFLFTFCFSSRNARGVIVLKVSYSRGWWILTIEFSVFWLTLRHKLSEYSTFTGKLFPRKIV